MIVPCARCRADVPVDPALFGAAIEVLCETCRARRDSERLARRRASVGAPLSHWTFDSIDQATGIEHGIKLARAWAAGEVDRVGLLGSVGTGKTRVAIAAAHEMVLRRRTLFFSAPELLARLGTGRLDAPARTATVNALIGDVAVVIDDLDKVRPTEYAAEILYLAIDSRTVGSAPLLVTTNLERDELARYWPQPYGEAIASRLCLLTWARFDGPDLREEAARA